jgi:uncharacterized protein YegP (UPF0339 family)
MAKRPYKITTYRGKDGQHRFRIEASNGRIVADGGEGYKRRSDRDNAIGHLVAAMRTENLKYVDIPEAN